MDRIKRLSFFLIFLFCIGILFLVGCGKDTRECEIDSDCAGDCRECTADGRCRTLNNCCGNNRCEANELCTCQKDCAAELEKTPYIAYEMIDNVCVSNVDIDRVTEESSIIKFSVGNSDFSIIPSYTNPFILGYSQMNINIKPDKVEPNTKFLIKRIRIYDQQARNTRVLISERDLNQYLYTINSNINENFILHWDIGDITEPQETKKDLQIEIIYDRIVRNERGDPTIRPGTFERQIARGIDFIIMPSSTCQVELCEDNNICTIDVCTAVGPYEYCTNQYTTTLCCGNKICDSNENKCTCPGDCGECNELFGNFIQYGCNLDNQCVPKVKEGIIEDQARIFKSSSIRDFNFDARIFFQQPMNIKESFRIELTLMQKDSKVRNIEIMSIQLIESSTNLLGEISVEEEFNDIGTMKSFLLNPSLLSMSEPERELRPRVVIKFRYTTIERDEERINLRDEIFTLDQIAFVNI
ncbi:MAG: hypothetical protein ACMXYG_06480 [Candidatus Woesearchaeota archaeon]